MRLCAVLIVFFLCSCALTRKEQTILICGNLSALDAKVVHLQRTLDKVYAHERLMELRQYEAIKTDGSIKFKGIVTAKDLTEIK
jgi:hypothetical protein